jgi:hypothetical protein
MRKLREREREDEEEGKGGKRDDDVEGKEEKTRGVHVDPTLTQPLRRLESRTILYLDVKLMDLGCTFSSKQRTHDLWTGFGPKQDACSTHRKPNNSSKIWAKFYYPSFNLDNR